jgi:Zn-dependent peptidase ImmA (M78 family)
MVRAVLEDEEASPLTFVGSHRLSDGPDSAAKALIALMEFDRSVFRGQRNPSAAFDYLRGLAEGAGVFVLLIGNLGSYQSAVDPEAFRGFALADDLAPFVIVNDQDARAAWSFTLLHEMAHVLIGATGVSGGRLEAAVERFCNEVAGRILTPEDELRRLDLNENDPEQMAASISAFANACNVSRAMIAYRLRLIGRIGDGVWQSLSERFREEYLRDRADRRDRDRAAEGGPNYYVVRRHRLGQAVLDLVGRAVAEGALAPTKAARVLGVRPRNLHALLSGSAA